MKKYLLPISFTILNGVLWIFAHFITGYIQIKQSFHINVIESAAFFICGAITAGILIALLQQTKSKRHKQITLTGYLLALLPTWILCAISDFILPPYIGILIFGISLPAILTFLSFEISQIYKF